MNEQTVPVETNDWSSILAEVFENPGHVDTATFVAAQSQANQHTHRANSFDTTSIHLSPHWQN